MTSATIERWSKFKVRALIGFLYGRGNPLTRVYKDLIPSMLMRLGTVKSCYMLKTGQSNAAIISNFVGKKLMHSMLCTRLNLDHAVCAIYFILNLC